MRFKLKVFIICICLCSMTFLGFLSSSCTVHRKRHKKISPLQEPSLIETRRIKQLIDHCRTPLHEAVATGEEVEVKHLLDEHVCDIEVLDANGETPLHLAVRTLQPDMIKFLLSRGANLEAKNQYGRTPLCVLFGIDDYKGATVLQIWEVIDLLVDAGAKVDAQDQIGWTPLHFAAKRDFYPLARRLILAGATVDSRAIDRKTPLHVASANGSCRVAKLLLDNGADPNAEATRYKFTSLHYAARFAKENIIWLLLSYGADPNAKISLFEFGFERSGNTPLHEIAMSLEGKNKPIHDSARALLICGADPYIKNSVEGETHTELTASEVAIGTYGKENNPVSNFLNKWCLKHPPEEYAQNFQDVVA